MKSPTHLDVAVSSGTVTVDAANVSLNQVVHEVAKKTGMKVTGGASEEKTFGHYGPAPAADVLAALLDGTGSNMLLVNNHTGPAELVLSPRHGGVTPPSSSASQASVNSSEQEQQTDPQYVPPTQPFRPPVALGRGPVRANADGSPSLDQPNQGDNSSGDGQKTPQQLLEELQSTVGQPPPQDPDPQQ